MAQKPSFFKSTKEGIAGFIKGTLAGGLVGIIAGGLVGAIIGAATGGFGLAVTGAGALLGAAYGGAVLGSIGSLAGTMTGVVRSREAGQVSGQDVTNIANIAFAQGLSMGHERAMASPETSGPESRKFREMIDRQREQAATQSKSIH